ncbi:class I SAM-dependent methyltransferase [Inquilinus limosus]|uniref:class I SAM-dependent methyltransferase n=1 Tax=Inquilinus limosus TaxID=171674 RepID=UPI003F1431E2
MFSSVGRTGEAFDDPDVAACYASRPPYPPELHRKLLELAPGRARLLDLGCGPGKLAIDLAPHFAHVIAVDPSEPMLRVARALGAEHENIRWVRARAEEVELEGPFDLIVVGAAIHWMRLDIVMPKLKGVLRPDAPLALVNGDEPGEAAWIDAYRAHLIRWVERGGGTWRDPVHTAPAYLDWIDIQSRESFSSEVDQSVEELIEAEHSRATWSRAAMGAEAASAFDSELRGILQPHAVAGRIRYRVDTRLVVCRPRSEPRDPQA